jgi:hypothetical protein
MRFLTHHGTLWNESLSVTPRGRRTIADCAFRPRGFRYRASRARRPKQLDVGALGVPQLSPLAN